MDRLCTNIPAYILFSRRLKTQQSGTSRSCTCTNPQCRSISTATILQRNPVSLPSKFTRKIQYSILRRRFGKCWNQRTDYSSPMTRSSFLRHAFPSLVVNQLTHHRQIFQKNLERTGIRELSSGAINRKRTPTSKTTPSCFHHCFLEGLLHSTSSILLFLTRRVCCFKLFHYMFLTYISLRAGRKLWRPAFLSAQEAPPRCAFC